MDKSRIKQILIESEMKLISEAEADYNAFVADNNLQQDDVLDLDDMAHSDSSLGFENDLLARIVNHKMNLQAIEDTPVEPCETVCYGAVVKVDDDYLYVSTAQKPLEIDGKRIEGISTQAPIYKLMSGKRVGDTYEFNGKLHRIHEVH